MTVPLAAAIIDTLTVFVGTIEIQPNVGFTGTHAADFTRLLERAGWEPHTNTPYCAYTATQVIVETFQKAGVPLPPQLMRSGSSSEIARHADKYGKLGAFPATGAIALMRGGSTGWHHTEVVIGVNGNGTFRTIGANTSDPNNEDVQGVFYKMRHTAEFDFIVW